MAANIAFKRYESPDALAVISTDVLPFVPLPGEHIELPIDVGMVTRRREVLKTFVILNRRVELRADGRGWEGVVYVSEVP